MFSSQMFTVCNKLYSQLASYKSTTVPIKSTAIEQLHYHEKPNTKSNFRVHSFIFPSMLSWHLLCDSLYSTWVLSLG